MLANREAASGEHISPEQHSGSQGFEPPRLHHPFTAVKPHFDTWLLHQFWSGFTIDAFKVSQGIIIRSGFGLGLSEIGAGSQAPKGARNIDETRQAAEADTDMGVASLKPTQGVTSQREPGAAGSQFAFHREPGAQFRQWRQVGKRRERAGCSAIDF